MNDHRRHQGCHRQKPHYLENHTRDKDIRSYTKRKCSVEYIASQLNNRHLATITWQDFCPIRLRSSYLSRRTAVAPRTFSGNDLHKPGKTFLPVNSPPRVRHSIHSRHFCVHFHQCNVAGLLLHPGEAANDHGADAAANDHGAAAASNDHDAAALRALHHR